MPKSLSRKKTLSRKSLSRKKTLSRKSFSRKKTLSRKNKGKSLRRSTYRRNARYNVNASDEVDALLLKKIPGRMITDPLARMDAIHEYVDQLVPLLRRGAEVSTKQCMEQIRRGIEYFPVVRELIKYGAPVNTMINGMTPLISLLRVLQASKEVSDFFDETMNLPHREVVINELTHNADQALYQMLARCDRETILAHNYEGRNAMFYATLPSYLPLPSTGSPFRAANALLKRGKQLGIVNELVQSITDDQSRLFLEHLMFSFRMNRRHLTWSPEIRETFMDRLLLFARTSVQEWGIDIDQQNKEGETVLLSSVKSYSEIDFRHFSPEEANILVSEMTQWIRFLVEELHARVDLEDDTGHAAAYYLRNHENNALKNLLHD